MTTPPTPRAVERAALAGVQAALLFLNHEPDEAAAFIKLMSAGTRPDSYAPPRHVKKPWRVH